MYNAHDNYKYIKVNNAHMTGDANFDEDTYTYNLTCRDLWKHCIYHLSEYNVK